MSGERDVSVTVVITNWNGRDLLATCLPAVLDQDLADEYEVVVVDNGSTDGSVEFVREKFPGVRVLETGGNNYAAANNLGVAGSSAEFVALLNSDTRVDRAWLSELVECARVDDHIGAVGSLILFTDGTINSTGIDLCDGFHWSDRGFGRAVENAAQMSTDDVYGLSGCAVLYRRACWRDAGGLDEDFHMYYEDVDMSLRCRKRGWRLAFCPSSIVHHEYNMSVSRADRASRERGVSGWRATPLKDRLGERNRLFVVARHYPGALAETIPQSRFYLEADPPELERGLRLALQKWSLPDVTAPQRAQCEAMLLRARAEIRNRERWRDRCRQLERQVADLERELGGTRNRYEQQIAANRDELAAVRSAYERQIDDLQRAMQHSVEGYEQQIASDERELADARAAYEAEIDHREGVIGELRRLLEQSRPRR